MSVPIKPSAPGPSPADLEGLDPLSGAEAIRSAEGPAAPVEGLTEAERLTPSAAADAVDPLTALRTGLEEGKLTVEEAIERLVMQALASAGSLSEGARSSLEAHLRGALSDDPTLGALARDLGSALKRT